MPTKTLEMCSPFEKLHHKLPNLEYFRIVGCACYPLMTPYCAHKLQPKIVRYIFLGIAAGYKGFICYNFTTKKVIISRHVFFDESVFPYANLNCSSSTSSTGSHVPSAAPISSVQPCFTHTQSPSYLPALFTHNSGQSFATSTQLCDLIILSFLFPHLLIILPLLVPLLLPLASSMKLSGASTSALFDDQSHTQIQFTESSGQVDVSATPGIGISVVLDCASSQSISNIS